MNESYTNFATVYDTFMDGTDYEKWADSFCSMIEKYSSVRTAKSGEVDADESLLASEKNLVVDLGCGTGKLTEIMAGRGYDMMGIDLSEDMLTMALERRDELGHKTMYLCQDMRDFELYGTAGTFISAGDSINYLLEDEDVTQMFRQVNLFLYPGGIFVFDFKTLHLYRDIIGDRTIAEDREDCSFIWDNWFDEETAINEYDLSLFVREGSEGDNVFRKYEEIHRQRGYTLRQIRGFAEKAGLEWVDAVDSETLGPVTEETERILAVVRECKK